MPDRMQKIFRKKVVEICDEIGKYVTVDQDVYEAAVFMTAASGYTPVLPYSSFSGAAQWKPILLSASGSLYNPAGYYQLGGSAAITVTVPGIVLADAGKISFFETFTAHAHVVSFTGATLISAGVAKTTATSGGAVGDFVMILADGTNGYVVVSSGGQTFA